MDIKLVHEDGRVWATTESGFTWHAFRVNEDGQAVALCRKNVRPRWHARTKDSYWTLEQTHRSAMTVRCDRCQDKLAEMVAPKESQGWTKKELRAAADEFAATAVTSTEVPAEELAQGVAPAPAKVDSHLSDDQIRAALVDLADPKNDAVRNSADILIRHYRAVLNARSGAVAPTGHLVLPVGTVTGDGPYQVVYLDTNARRVHTRNHPTELDAVRNLTDVQLISNLELVSRSDNIDKTKFRF
ncbi:hypothetical protein OG879_31525 [Streptomyces caniferus]|uniref:hypothetical protein n=1 Tax=Streptomyces caniferus TaxID=285557 RepID=UPI002E284624|nr:hypothetical protein [Streptomyces caniferus]